jgi:hypothetical protein
MRGDDLGERLDSLKAELEFKVDVGFRLCFCYLLSPKVLKTELNTEREKTSTDISDIDFRVKGEFINRLKVEIDILRGTYEEFTRATRERLEERYKGPLTRLQLQLTLALSKHVSTDDIEAIRCAFINRRL